MRSVQEVRVFVRDYARTVEIVPITEHPDGSISVALLKDGKFVVHNLPAENHMSGEDLEKNGFGSVLKVSSEWAKMLRDALLREFGHPEKTATEQELKATKRHLEDMRRLALKGTEKIPE